MKAVRTRNPGGLEELEVVEMADPGIPGPGHLRVRVHATSLNYHDYMVANGTRKLADGLIPMADGAGVVEAVGEGVTGFAAGDNVVSVFFPQWQDGPPQVSGFLQTPGDGVDGFAREIVVMPAAGFTKAPAGYSHAESGTLPTAGLTAWRALVVNGGLKAGDTVLILGTGGVSIFALQFARIMGATVVATSSSDEKLERLRALGAAHVINYRTQPEWGREAFEWTGGRGVDQVVEIGGPGTLAQSIAAVRIGGHISLIGVLTGRAGEVPTAALSAKQARLQGQYTGSRADQVDMIRGLNVSGTRPIIDRSFPLELLANAFRYQESGKHLGKVVVEF